MSERPARDIPGIAGSVLAIVAGGLAWYHAGAFSAMGAVFPRTIAAVMAIAAAVIYSVYIIVGANVMKHVSAAQSSTVIFASAGAVFGTITLINGAHFPIAVNGWYSMIGIVLISTVVPVVAFLTGLELIGPTNAATLSTLEPVVTVLLAAWLFQERLSPIALLGGGLILVAVILLTRSELQKIKPAEGTPN